MALFESYERRIDQIIPVLNKYGMIKLEDAKAVCAEIGIDPYTISKKLNQSHSKMLNGLTL